MDYFYIYNPSQAEYFRNRGVEILEIGKGKKGDVFIKFPRTEESDIVFKDWIEKCNRVKEIMSEK